MLILAVDVSNDNITNVHIINAPSDDKVLLTATVATSLNSPPTEKEFIVEHASDWSYKSASVKFALLSSEFHTEHCILLNRKSTINKVTQIVVVASLRERISYLAHHQPIVRKPCQRRMYDTL